MLTLFPFNLTFFAILAINYVYNGSDLKVVWLGEEEARDVMRGEKSILRL